MNIAVFSTKPYDKDFLNMYNANHEISFFDSSLNINTVSLSKGFDVVCVFVNDKVDKQIIEILAQNGVGLIALRCAGFNNVDLSAAKKHNIKVVRVPAYSPEAVAEHTVALILTLNRKTHKAYNRVREGNFSLQNLIGFDLYKKSVGVIGTGKIGAAFCKIMLGFGCVVMAYDVYPSQELIDSGVKYLELDKIYEQSDIISLHCPLTADTKHIINAHSLEKMKDGVMIINTSRGGLINTSDIVEALKTKKVGYLGIDVYEQEENLFFQDFSEQLIEDELILRLISFPNVLITSHQAFLTFEALTEISKTVYKNIDAFENHEDLKNEVIQ